jgi:hypothetical protein
MPERVNYGDDYYLRVLFNFSKLYNGMQA